MANNQQEQNQNYSEDFLTEVNVKLRDIEEKQNLVKDRILLIGDNLISEKQEIDEELIQIKQKVKDLEKENIKIKLTLQRLIESQENFARKSEIQILERQFQMFEPLKFARISDVEQIVKKEVEKLKRK